MKNYLQRTGVTMPMLDQLSVIHVAGTKGKGSTSAMCESILHTHGFRTGFYSSPHLVEVRERIRLDGITLTRSQFAEHFSQVYNALYSTQSFEGDMPKYFAFLTVLAFNVFLKERVDVAIVEVGIGGIVDYTNILRKVPVVGITALGLDHTSILGHTLPEIAAAKAGIMKRGCEAYTMQQPPEALDVLRTVASNTEVSDCPTGRVSMHMWMWFGYDLGEFLFSGLNINTRWAFALTWIVLFFVALLFEGSKVYLAGVQREAYKKLNPYRCDERRNLLCDREQGNPMEPTTSRNPSTGQISRWASFKVRTLVNGHQTLVFIIHNVVGYLLMLAVMIYNVHLLLAVVFGMMLGYFLFGTKLTRLQMQCFRTKRMVICTPECDDTAENTTPPLLDSSQNSETEFFICQTRNCIQPSHYFPTSPETGESSGATCYYGAKKCPSKVARAKKTQAGTSSCHHESEKEESPSVEDAQLLRHTCCKKIEVEGKCCKSSPSTAAVHDEKHCDLEPSEEKAQSREESPQVSCCHNAKPPSGSQEQIIK
ncbi:uncharacterized protein [Maniola hyperantus]